MTFEFASEREASEFGKAHLGTVVGRLVHFDRVVQLRGIGKRWQEAHVVDFFGSFVVVDYKFAYLDAVAHDDSARQYRRFERKGGRIVVGAAFAPKGPADFVVQPGRWRY